MEEQKKGMSGASKAVLIGCGIFSALFVMVTVLGIVAAIAIPSLLRSMLAANETGAIASLRAIAGAQTMFLNSDANANGVKDFSSTVEALNATIVGGVPVGYIDKSLADGQDTGYDFKMMYADKYSWSACATPTTYASSGIRTFTINQEGIVLGSDNAGAPATFEEATSEGWIKP